MNDLVTFRGINFGDCEVDLVAFIGDNARINIINHFNSRKIAAEFCDVDYLIIETNHLQNVISSIEIFDKLSDIYKNELACRFIKERNINPPDGNSFYAYFEPISGFEVFIIFKRIDWRYF